MKKYKNMSYAERIRRRIPLKEQRLEEADERNRCLLFATAAAVIFLGKLYMLQKNKRKAGNEKQI